ncbi:MAG TPA: sulfatase-like hydrolase/transferase [Planctomycetota bacterium]|nr:sulfatase-like hydrolase/transferase [Planctomycetota bacterium]
MAARVALLLLTLSLHAVLAACSPHVDTRSAILITLDTTRYDALGSYGASPSVTPNLDRLASESLRYDWARTTAPMTLPAHASILTGLYPPRHTVRGNGPMTLPPAAVTLAELARDAGFQTAGFVASLALDRAYGIAQGFDTWNQPDPWVARPDSRDFHEQISDRPAQDVIRAARAWLRGRDRSRPFLLWVHLFDPHAPYEPPAVFLERAGGDPYLGEVAAMDAALGDLFADLASEDLLERATLCIVADHGEGRGDHGEESHALLCYDSTLRVPLLVRYADGYRAGEVASEPVTVADLFPTLLDAMGLAVPSALDGQSLWRRSPDAGRGVYFESFYGWTTFGWSPLSGWVDAEAKYLHSPQPQLFRPREDPKELGEVAADLSELERYRRAIAAVAAAPAIASDSRREVDAAARAPLEALGYVASAGLSTEFPGPLEDLDRPAPRLEDLAAYNRALALVRAGKLEQTAETLEDLARRNPWSVLVLDLRAEALERQGNLSAAVEVLNERLRLPPEQIATHQSLVRCHGSLGNPDLARRHTLRALELFIQAHERRGEPELAQSYRELLERTRGIGRR